MFQTVKALPVIGQKFCFGVIVLSQHAKLLQLVISPQY